MSEKIEVMESVYERNDRISKETNEFLKSRGVLAVNVLGAPGAGKTSLIESLVKRAGIRSYVVEGDIESDIDVKRLGEQGIEAVQINTHGACHLDASVVKKALSEIEFSEPGILFVENIGNLICPAELTIGEHAVMLVLTVTEGSDKPYKYPLAFQKADVIVLNKSDLLAYVEFDERYFMEGVRTLNPDVPVFKVSAKTGAGVGDVVEWLKERKKNTI